ncbi:ankyrin repeat domain-containing protein, partial [Acidobacteriota bacterium]
MKDMLQFLYEKFLMRDIIGKLTPGFIVLLTFYYSLNDSIFHTSLKDPSFKIAVWLIFPISYLIGIILQIVGELIGLHWTCKTPKFILLFPTYDHLNDWEKMMKFKIKTKKGLTTKKRNMALFIVFFLLIPVIPLLSQDIHDLSKKGDIIQIKALIEKDQELINKKDDQGWSPLHHASFHGHNEVVEFLIVSGAEINALDNLGNTPLHRASLRGHVNITRLLIEAGADLNKISAFGFTPLAYAVRGNQKEVTEYLISKGADVNLRQGDGDAPLHTAAVFGRKEIVELLLSNNTDINIRRRYDITPLHFAAAGGHKE